MQTTTTAPTRAFVGDSVIRAWHAGARRPLGMVLSTTAFAAAATALSAAATRTAVPTAAALGAVLTLCGAAALVDLHEQRLPNPLLTAALAVTAAAALVDAIGDGGPGRLGAVLIGLVAGGAPLLVVHLRRGIGMGDVKFAAVLGAAGGLVGPWVAPLTVLVGALLSATVGVITRRDRLALGPWWWASWVTVTVITLTGGATGVGAAAASSTWGLR